MAPASASRHYRRLQRLQYVTLTAVRRAWRRMEPGGSWERQYATDVGPKVLAVVTAAQIAATRESDAYVADVLNELAFGPTTRPGVVVPSSLAGVAGDGRPLETLLSSSVGRARSVDASPSDALDDGLAFIERVAQTIIADATRAAEEVAMAQRPWVAGYVRVAEPGACSRCIVLAGKFYLFNEGFLRHPLCRCNHLPAPSDPDKVKALIGVNSPDRYFESLSEAEQNRVFTEAGARAIREGADIAQVVNARRGMSTAQRLAQNEAFAKVFGESLKTTSKTEAKRLAQEAFRAAALPGRQRLIRNPDGLFTTDEGGSMRSRFSRTQELRMASGERTAWVRLMPESIFEIAGDDRDEALRLLKLYGFIL